MEQVVNVPADVHYPVVEMSTRSRLTSLSWNKHIKNQIASSDYEGIVTVWDVNTRQVREFLNSMQIFVVFYSYFHFPKKYHLESFRASWNMRNMRSALGL
jgi:WD40 repeat protein